MVRGALRENTGRINKFNKTKETSLLKTMLRFLMKPQLEDLL